MPALVRSAIILVIAVGIAFSLLWLFADRDRCPPGQKPVLSDTKWICVKEG